MAYGTGQSIVLSKCQYSLIFKLSQFGVNVDINKSKYGSWSWNIKRYSPQFWWKVFDIWVQSPMKLHPSLPCAWSILLINWYSVWLGPSHFVSHWQRQEDCVWTPQLFWVYTQNRHLEDREDQLAEFDMNVLDLNGGRHLTVRLDNM